MKARDIITGFIVLVVLIAGVLLIKNAKNKKQAAVAPQTPSIEQKIKDTFNGMTIPTDTEKAELKDVSGGDGFGVATRTEILADLPEPPKGQYYQAKLANTQGKMVLIGSFRIAKGGYLLEYNSAKYPGYDKVLVVLGTKTILEGSF